MTMFLSLTHSPLCKAFFVGVNLLISICIFYVLIGVIGMWSTVDRDMVG